MFEALWHEVGEAGAEARVERKFGSGLDAAAVRARLMLVPALFRPHYPPRIVQSLYLDDTDLTDARESAAGLAERAKVRLRWYGNGDEQGRVWLELKLRKGQVGKKLRVPLQMDDVGPWSPAAIPTHVEKTRAWLDRALNTADVGPSIRAAVRSRQPKLCVTYRRQYFVSQRQSARATIDFALSFEKVGGVDAPSRHLLATHAGVVVEVKHSVDVPLHPDDLEGLGLRLTRHSKYAMAAHHVFGIPPDA